MSAAGQRTRYAIVGLGHRAETYVDAITLRHSDVAELVALVDTNTTRAQYYADKLAERGAGADIFHPDLLPSLITQLGVQRVIITTPDFLHAHYIETAQRAGADVIVEKPLTIDAASAQRIADVVAETGRNVVVTFNYRYSPRNTALKELIASGAIGTVTAVHFEWLLDTSHGADYFRRWHREKAHSGGLLVHKSSHFDLVNWWLDDSPRSIFAQGGLRFYGPENAEKRGLVNRPSRGTHEGATDGFQLDLRDDPRLKALYLDAEADDGYVRDRDVFTDGITIEDTLAVLVGYDSGAVMTYSLTAYSPWEGYRVSVTGTEGRAELEVVERAAVLYCGTGIVDPSLNLDDSGANESRGPGHRLVLQRLWSEAEEIPITSGEGEHGGGDDLLLSDIFVGSTDDPLGRPASWVDGVRSIAVGIAGNESLGTGLPVLVSDLGLGVDVSRKRDDQ